MAVSRRQPIRHPCCFPARIDALPPLTVTQSSNSITIAHMTVNHLLAVAIEGTLPRKPWWAWQELMQVVLSRGAVVWPAHRMTLPLDMPILRSKLLLSIPPQNRPSLAKDWQKDSLDSSTTIRSQPLLKRQQPWSKFSSLTTLKL